MHVECQIRTEEKNTGYHFDLRYLGRSIRTALFGLLISSGLWTLGGCASVGPDMLKVERINYNVALQNMNDEQMLLNLVRLRYRNTPIFLDVASISTQFTIEAVLEAGAELPERTL